MPSRWDHLFDRKPVSLSEHLVEEVSKLLATDLAGWPLPVQELDLATGRAFAPFLDANSERPREEVFTQAVRMARWDLEREVDAADDYVRNRRWMEHGLAPDDKLALLFVSRWLVEQLLAVQEATEGRVSRKMLVDCLDRTGRRMGRVLPGTGPP
jgi:hypothetical protein